MLGAKTTASQAQVGQGDVAEVGGPSQSSPNVGSTTSAQQQQQQQQQQGSGGGVNNEQVRVYIARYDYNPYDGPNPCPDMELYLQAGNTSQPT